MRVKGHWCGPPPCNQPGLLNACARAFPCLPLLAPGRTAIHLACQPPPRSGQVAEHYVSSPLGMLLAALDGLVKKHNADYPNDRKKMADLVKHPPGYPDAGRHYDEDQLWPMCLVRYGFDPAEWWR